MLGFAVLHNLLETYSMTDLALNLDQIDGVITDMDGVLWRGDEPLPGLRPFFALVRERGLPLVLATNNSSKSPADYVAKLAKMGVDGVREDQIVTSGTTTLHYLRTTYPAGTPVHVVGGTSFKQMVAAAGFPLVDDAPRAVIVGLDPEATYDRLKRAALLLRAGADFIGTNADKTFPSPEGLVPGAGSLLALLITATDRQPLVMGKPAAPMFAEALARLGTQPGRTLMIGDRLDTDIAGAAALGLPTAMVLTGVNAADDVHTVRPSAVFDGLDTLVQAWA